MAIGPSTTQTPYLVPSTGNVSFTSLLSVGDTVPGSVKADGTPWRFVGIPDGIGAFDNGDGTATVLVNHEIGATSGVVRAHGSAGAFVDRLVVDKASLKVLSAGDLGTSYYGFNAATGAYVQGTTALARLCSADLPAVSAFYDASTGLGTKARIFMNGEETGAEGRALAWVVNGPEAGRIYELPRLGKFSMENSLANPATGVKTVTIGTDDSATGQLYVYVGTKQATGSEIDKAGLTNGKLYGIKVPSVLVETNATSVAAAGAAFSLQEMGPNGDVSRMTGAQLQAESDAEGVTTFLRPEDGAWDPSNPNRFYFNTTNAITSPSRLWALEFTDVTRPELGGTVKEVLRGTEGQVMLDNMTVTADGKVILQEDPGNNARISKIFQYDPANGSLTELAQHDPARFGTPPTAPFNQDEESSGIVDVSTIFGGPGRQAFLLDTQAHYTLGGELVEGGQLMLMTQDRSIRGTDGNDTLTGSAIDDLIDGRAGTDTLVFGSRLADATVTRDGAYTLIVGPEGRDRVAGFERYQFTDATVVTGDGAPLVDDLFYLAANKDVLAAGQDADAHYALYGWKEGRDPNALFSTTGYLAANPAVRASGQNPLEQYDQAGWKEGRDPSAAFDNELYLARNPDVKAAGVDPLAHYLLYGQGEGRETFAAIGRTADLGGHPGFDAEYYLLSNLDVARAATGSGRDPFAFAYDHYQLYGWKEGRNPNAVFDTKGYLDAYGDVKAAGVDPLLHYDLYGWEEGRDPSKAFDTTAYLAANGDVARAKVDPMLHYLQYGALEGRAAPGDTTFGYGNQG
ncbi:alkaline phosphatase PhoX [Methylobacterium aquaticum]|uniref:Uncharacterized protein n=1 Tax=Methylobacterium aquaticum TaxID=270351 RepID=A0A0C6FT21_9HYPH|nr:alkaline phosphatase PhoX [Methylobacterium aquaticum]BAQ48669.1 protein of unknown function DUF839 [Methylobacterium aquaticum]